MSLRIFDSGNKKLLPPSPTDEPGLRGRVIDAIKGVYDPELPINLYDLGLIYRLDLDEGSGVVDIDMTLTSPNCPVADSLPNAVKAAVLQTPGVTACQVKLVWEPKWGRDRLSDDALLALGLI